ncbi:MAG: hemolysin III family protein, partial [Oscillibacter sp.]|nr:hemolysin III family protein [Oscillibacter sp.]
MEGIRRVPMELRLARREAIRAKNEPPRLTVGEEVFNAVNHGVGTGLAIAGFVLLLLRSDTPLKMTATCFYGISMIVMMLSSCIYHAMPAGSAIKRICRRLDYSSIYLLIGGTFAPILLVFLGNRLGIVFFCIQWGVILTGVTLVAVFGPGRWRPLHFTLYFVLGW